MINIPAIRAFTKIRTEAIPDVTKTWKIGQLLNATAEADVNANNKLLMRVGQTIMETTTPVSLQAGDKLKLIVKTLGETPVLKIQTQPAQLPVTTQDIAAQNLKSFIAQQQDLSSVLKLSQQIVENTTLPKILKQQITDLNQKLPTAEQASQAKVLKAIIQDSGILLESKLNRLQQHTSQQPGLSQDIKSQLLKINTQLQNIAPELAAKPRLSLANSTHLFIEPQVRQLINGNINLVQFSTQLVNQLPKEQLQQVLQVLATADKILLPKTLINSFTPLLNHIQQQAKPQQVLENLSTLIKTIELLQELKTNIDGALAKITTQQLMTVSRESDSLLLLIFDLFLKHKTENHLIQFRLEEEQSASKQNDSSWKVTLNFNFEESGPIQAQLHLSGNRISTVFRAQEENTADNISQHIKLLETALRDIGFDAVNLDVSHNSFNQDSFSNTRALPENIHILDEKV